MPVRSALTYAQDTLVNLFRLWTRPVHVHTVVNETKVTLSFDGQEHQTDEEGPIDSED